MNLNELREVTKKEGWTYLCERVLAGESLVLNDFDTYWVEAGHRIREQIGNDSLLSQMLRRLLPPYQGGPIRLYRGENIYRWNLGKVGFCWTEDIEIARMFAQGLNAVRGGGVLLSGEFQPEAVISGPGSHSRYLGENQFTVDPFLLATTCALAKYPECE